MTIVWIPLYTDQMRGRRKKRVLRPGRGHVPPIDVQESVTCATNYVYRWDSDDPGLCLKADHTRSSTARPARSETIYELRENISKVANSVSYKYVKLYILIYVKMVNMWI